MEDRTPGEREARLKAVADEALARAGRRPLPPSQVETKDYDLSQAPGWIQALARSVDGMSDEDIRLEAHNQWPVTTDHLGKGFPSDPKSGTWFPEEMVAARNKVKGFVLGVALGITRIEAEPLTEIAKVAVKLCTDAAGRMAAEKRAERMGIGRMAKVQAAARQKARKARKARRKNRG